MKSRRVSSVIMGSLVIAFGLLIFALMYFLGDVSDTATDVIGYGTSAFMVFVGVLVIVIGFRESAFDKIVKADGKDTEGRIIALTVGEDNTYALIEFMDEYGINQKFSVYDYKGSGQQGDKIQIRYIRRKNGKVVARCAEKIADN